MEKLWQIHQKGKEKILLESVLKKMEGYGNAPPKLLPPSWERGASTYFLQNVKHIVGKKFLKCDKIIKINNSDKTLIAVIYNPAPIYRFFGQRTRKDRIK